MFNNHLFRTSAIRTNYFYDLIRSGGFDKEKFKEDYIKFFSRYQVSQKMIDGLDFLLTYPQIIDELGELKNHIATLNISFDEFMKYGDDFFIKTLRGPIIQSPNIDIVEYNDAKKIIMNYDYCVSVLNKMGDEDEYKSWNFTHTKDEILRLISEYEPKLESARQTIQSYDNDVAKIKEENVLSYWNLTYNQVDNITKRCYSLIHGMLDLVGSSNVKMLKYFMKDIVFFNALFDRSIPTTPLVEPNREIETDSKSFNYNYEASKKEFIDEYIKKYSLALSGENPDFIIKLGTLWAYGQINNQLFSNGAELKKVLSGKISSDDINSDVLKSIDDANKKFRVKYISALRAKDYNWYLDNLKYLESNRNKYDDARHFNSYISSPEEYNNAKIQVNKNKTFIRDYKRLYNLVEMFKEKYDEWSKDKVIVPPGETLYDLSEVYNKINLSLGFLDNNESKSKFIESFIEDDRFNALFGAAINFNNTRKLEILLENYISIDRKKRVNIVKKLTDPIAFRRILKTEYPELLNLLIEEGLMNKNEILIDEELYTIKAKLIQSMKIYPSELKEIPSKYFSEFNLNNSSDQEKQLFSEFEKLGLHAIPATQSLTLKMKDEQGIPLGFRIDFLLPCNVRVYDENGNYTLKEDIIFIGEYFGYYGEDYERKTERKVNAQNMIERTLDQRCLHIKDRKNLCPVLMEKNIDSKCYSDYKKSLYDIENQNEKKIFFVKSQLQHFLYVSLIGELMWQVDFNHSNVTVENYNIIKEKNKPFIDAFENLLSEVNDLSSIELRRKCSVIFWNYKNKFDMDKWGGRRLFKTSSKYNIRIK